MVQFGEKGFCDLTLNVYQKKRGFLRKLINKVFVLES